VSNKLLKLVGSAWGQRISIFVLVMIVMAIFEPNFFMFSNIRSILLAVSIYGIMGCGMLLVIVTGGIDLSIGSTAAMAGCIAAKTFMDHGYTYGGLAFGIALALLFCVALGLFHGIEVTYFRMPAFVMTLATKYAVYGLIQIYTKGVYVQPVYENNKFAVIGQSRPLDIPMPIIIMVVCVAVTAVLLSRTSFGRKCYAVGGNPNASKLVGINTNRHTICVYVLCSFICGIGGIVLASFNMSVSQVTASGYEGTVLTAMVIGGINVFGGEGGVSGAIFGTIFVGVINNMLILLDVPPDYQKFVQGIIIIAAIAANMQVYRRSVGLTASASKRRNRAAIKKEQGQTE
jgi:ribose/xylose/arabinose/galactoside ABC-type transport system permease subunit